MTLKSIILGEMDLLRSLSKQPAVAGRMKALFVFALLLSTPGLAFAQAPGVDEMFANFSSSTIAIFNFVMKSTMLLGILLAGKSLMSFKEYSDSGGRTALKTPVMTLAAAVFLFSFPTTMGVATQTLALGGFSGTNIMSEGVPSGGGLPGADAAIRGVLLFVKLVGLIAAVRGFLMFKKISEGNSQQGVGVALTHVFGGAMALNIETTYNILKNSVGWS